MPPKKKDEEVDLASLPPWLRVICAFSLNMKRTHALKLLEKMRTAPKSFQKTIHRDEIVAYAKDKGLYVDPAALTEKQKKDLKYMELIANSMDLNAKVLAKAFSQMISETDIQGQKVKIIVFSIKLIYYSYYRRKKIKSKVKSLHQIKKKKRMRKRLLLLRKKKKKLLKRKKKKRNNSLKKNITRPLTFYTSC